MYQLGLKLPHPLVFDCNVVGQVGTPAEIDHHRAQSLVQWHGGVTEALNPGPFGQRLMKGASNHDSDVLYRMMVVDGQVAGGVDCEVEKAVAGEAVEHMIQERNPGGDFAAAVAVKCQFQMDRGLACLAFDHGAPEIASRRMIGTCISCHRPVCSCGPLPAAVRGHGRALQNLPCAPGARPSAPACAAPSA